MAKKLDDLIASLPKDRQARVQARVMELTTLKDLRLAAQQTQVQMYSLMAGSGVHFLLVLFFVDLLDLGFTGICISTSIMWLARFLVV